jgi:putative transposase
VTAERDEAAARVEDENNRLKRIVADLSLDKEMLQDIVRRKI